MNINRFCRRISFGVLSCFVAAGSLSGVMTASAADKPSIQSDDYFFIEPVDTGIPSYSDYYDEHSGEKRPEKEIVIHAADYKSAKDGTFTKGSYGSDDDIRDNVLIWESADGNLSYDINVEETGIYCLGIKYFPIESNSSQVEFSMKIDGASPYDTATRLTLNRVWINEADIHTDSRGNQIRPSQIQKGMWKECAFGDIDGLFGEPLFFYLEKGRHEISFSSERAELAIESLRFYNPEQLPTYEEYKNNITSIGISDSSEPNIFRIEGENADIKSDSTLYPTYDNTSYIVSPSDPRKVVYNTLGSGNWKKALQSVTWNISKDDIR